METNSREIRYLYEGSRLGNRQSSSNGTLERSFQAYLLVLLRYKLIIALTSLVVIGVTVLYTKSLPRLYETSAMVSIGAYIPPVEGPMAELLNLSINQTLSRTLMTSITTMLALLALWGFGGEGFA